MSRFFISIVIVLWGVNCIAQSKPIDLQPKDTVQHKEAYGIRLGVDLSRPVLSFTTDDYTGLEFVGDYRITEKLWLAAELGNEKRTGREDLYSFTTSGSYLKLGVDFNTYQNWFGMHNSITFGGRYAFSTFSQTLNGGYQIFNSNRYFSETDFAQGLNDENEEFDGLNASWLELVVGIKAELFANIYLGMSIRLGHLVTNTEDDRFPNLWIPGFNKVTDGAKWGVGYNYSISYFLPFYKKAKKKRETIETTQ